MNTNTNQIAIQEHIIESVKAGQIGCATMDLYDQGTVREINKAIRGLLRERKITISSPVTGYRLETENEYGVNQALATRNYDIKLGKNA